MLAKCLSSDRRNWDGYRFGEMKQDKESDASAPKEHGMGKYHSFGELRLGSDSVSYKLNDIAKSRLKSGSEIM